MKRLICIDGSRWPEDIGNEPLLIEGAIYLAELTVFGNTKQGRRVLCYKLFGIDLPAVYNVKRFIMTQQEQIINYLAQRTNGVLAITAADADMIIAMCQPPPPATAVFSKYNNQRGCYELYRNIVTTDAAINTVMAIHTKQVEYFNRYELYNSQHTHVATIYSLNADLL